MTETLNAEYVCPMCGRTDTLEVCAHVWVHLIQTEDGDIETEVSSHDGSHDWDGDSVAACTDCHWAGWTIDLAAAARDQLRQGRSS